MSRPLYSSIVWFLVLSLLLSSELILRPVLVAGSVSEVRAIELAAPTRPAPDAALSIPTNAMDGETVNFAIRILAGNPVGYQWSFETKSGGKDRAQLNIENAANSATPAIAYWYSTGHNKCGVDFTSVYTIKVRVAFDDGTELVKKGTFSVSVGKSWGGNVDPPMTRGAPDLRYDDKTRQWSVVGPGTLERVSNPLKLRLPTSSQFYEKVRRHEEVHVKQFEGGVLSDLFRIDSLMDWLRKTTPSAADKHALEQKVFTEIANWRQSQQVLMMKLLPAAEREAYAVSDQIEPRYIFQNCGRF